MKICFVYYPGKATQVVPLVAAKEEGEEEEEDEDDGNVKTIVDDHDNNNNNNSNNKNDDNDNDVVISQEPVPSDDMNSYEASWQECRLKWCLRSRSKERHDAAASWTEDDEDDRGESGGGRGRTQVVRRNPSEKRQACSSDSTGSSQEEQDAAAWAAASARRPKAKPLSRVQSVRHDTAAHRYRTRQRVAAEILDEQRAEASAAAARDLCRSSAAKIKKSLSFRNPAPKKVATGGDRLLRTVADDDHFHHYPHHNNNNNIIDNRQPRRHPHDKDKNHSHHHHDNSDEQQQLLTVAAGTSFVTAATALAATTVSPSAANATAADSGQDNFAIPRPKLIVPVHTYGLRKRRTGNTISSNRTASDVNVTSASSTVASSSGSSSNSTSTSASDTKKHHNSCPGKNKNYLNPYFNIYLRWYHPYMCGVIREKMNKRKIQRYISFIVYLLL